MADRKKNKQRSDLQNTTQQTFDFDAVCNISIDIL